jgi:hypothetical protein
MLTEETNNKLIEIGSAKDWITLRQTRNTVSHEYPFYKEIQIEEFSAYFPT